MRVVCAVGNTFRRDDGVGIEVGRLLEGEFKVFFCETNPESFLEGVCALKPSEVIIVDGGEFGGSPGEFREITIEDVDNHTISTHTLPLSLFASFLLQCCRRVRIFLVQVKDLGYGEGLSPEVQQGAKALAEFIRGSA